VVSAGAPRKARPASSSSTGAASRAAVCASRKAARTWPGRGGHAQGGVWGSGRGAAPLGDLARKHDDQYQLRRTRELDVAPAESTADAQDEGLQQGAGVVGKTLV